MNITMTVGRLIEIGAWDEVCEVKGYNVWAVNEGLIDSSAKIELSSEDLDKCPTVRRFVARQMAEWGE